MDSTFTSAELKDCDKLTPTEAELLFPGCLDGRLNCDGYEYQMAYAIESTFFGQTHFVVAPVGTLWLVEHHQSHGGYRVARYAWDPESGRWQRYVGIATS